MCCVSLSNYLFTYYVQLFRSGSNPSIWIVYYAKLIAKRYKNNHGCAFLTSNELTFSWKLKDWLILDFVGLIWLLNVKEVLSIFVQWVAIEKMELLPGHIVYTICPGSSDPFFYSKPTIEKRVTTSWTYCSKVWSKWG